MIACLGMYRIWGTLEMNQSFSQKSGRKKTAGECNIKMNHHEIECEVM
jgi:hypothetical protein